MKKLIYSLSLLCITTFSWGQYDAFTFQALLLDANANPIASANTLVRVSLTDANQSTTYYQEEQDLLSTENGVIAFNVGDGVALQGAIADVDWLAGVPYVQVAYNLMDDKGWHQLEGKKFHSVPFSLNSRFVVCQDGPDGQQGPTGPQGPIGYQGAQAPSGVQGNQGPAGPAGVPVIVRLTTPPNNPVIGRVYLDDGSNRGDSSPGFRYYDGSKWLDL